MKKTPGGRRLISFKNLIMMFVILVVILGTIFAWFSRNKEVTANSMTVQAKGNDLVELALPEKVDGQDSFPLDNADWSSDIVFKKTGYLKDLVKDVTSDGIQFVVPNFEASSSLKEGRKVNTDDVWVDGLSSKEALNNDIANDDDQYDYLSFDFYIRSTSKSIRVREGSFLASGSELGIKDNGKTDTNGNNVVTSKKALVGRGVYRPSSYGPGTDSDYCFSADAVIGAMRVSLVGTQVASIENMNAAVKNDVLTSDPSLKFLWLPRPDLFLNTNDNSNDWRLLTGIGVNNSVSSDTYDETNKTYCHSFYKGLWNNNEETAANAEGTIRKGLKQQVYWDSSVTTEKTKDSSVFYVSNTIGDNQLGQVGHVPTLNQSAQIAGGDVSSVSNISFNATSDPEDERPTSGYYVYKFTMNIWVEGEDAEARRSMNTGMFSLVLDFSN